MASGVKTYNGAVRADTNKVRLTNIVELAEAHAKWTGVMVSVPFSHVTPAAFVAHNAHGENYEAIAREIYWAALWR